MENEDSKWDYFWAVLFLALGLLGALWGVYPDEAYSANVATPKMEAVASWAAGKPVSVHCENDEAEWARMLASVGHTQNQAGYAYIGASVVYVGPDACAYLAQENSVLLGLGLTTLLHEATHARGWEDEALAECAARVLIYSTLNRFYGVPWFSPRMRLTVGAALAQSLARPAIYQNGCSRL